MEVTNESARWWEKVSSYMTIYISIYTLSDLGDLSNLIGRYLGLFNNILLLASG